ncbi:hypothetical protein [Streptomyces sedi]|uniref:Uncharacterized protein n=1 Tax=Streptomyces sedi TaxID=555059 RepID=A0A5C4VET4_9ACTN|nr:hypothetical protein [Streptomyces sedi]TNM34414.1 hypothetical protein FH715_01665 [Streptomyces sedi]
MPLAAIGVIGPEWWRFSLLWFAAILPFGVWFGVRHYVRARRDTQRRAEEPGLMIVEVPRWGKRGLRWQRTMDLAGQRFTLELRQRADGIAGTLSDATGTEIIQLPEWTQQPGWLRRELKRRSLSGEYLDVTTRETLTIWLREEEITICCGQNPAYEVKRQGICSGDRVLATRDTLGWRVSNDLTRGDAAICALTLLAGIADSV